MAGCLAGLDVVCGVFNSLLFILERSRCFGVRQATGKASVPVPTTIANSAEVLDADRIIVEESFKRSKRFAGLVPEFVVAHVFVWCVL